MTNQQHPITPPAKLMEQWSRELDCSEPTFAQVAIKAARWGANQELEACISAILDYPGFEHPELFVEVLRAARRPKPPSLKIQALKAMNRCENEIWCEEIERDLAIIRTALEQLDD